MLPHDSALWMQDKLSRDSSSLLRVAGMKVTVPRLAVLELLRQRRQAMDVHQIYHALLETREISLSSLYVVLKQLAVMNVIDVHVGPKKTLYSLLGSINTAVMTCIGCGKTNTSDLELFSREVANHCETSGVVLKGFNVDMLVICSNCRKRQVHLIR
ncbi:Fur family transcriptional regulator [Corticibacter populi]|nr:transcriptional repressor [Corticibacter populi]RZS35090.1 Fur family ferric uptake transcriptional regulator [Corticibacter populi]